MELPQGITDAAFTQACQRGVVLRFLMSDLDDPNRDTRNKFAVVLNVDPSDPEILLVLTTSNVELFRSAAKWVGDSILELSAGSYPWTTKDTVIDLRSVRPYPVEAFKKMYSAGKLDFHGPLSKVDLERIDDILRTSRDLTPAEKKRVVP
jgi:hypothetical protein